MIEYKDFAPKMTAERTLLKAEQFETFDEAVTAANAWLASEDTLSLVNMETVVLPNMWRSVEEGTVDGSLSAAGNIATWHQFVRVWYRRG